MTNSTADSRNFTVVLEAFAAHRHTFGAVPLFAVGHSFGGVLTTLLLAQAEQLFQRAVLLDPVLFSRGMAASMALVNLLRMGRFVPLARATLRRRRHWPRRAAALQSLQGRGAYRGWIDDALVAFVEHALRDSTDGGVELKCHPETEACVFSSGPRGLWRSTASQRQPNVRQADRLISPSAAGRQHSTAPEYTRKIWTTEPERFTITTATACRETQ